MNKYVIITSTIGRMGGAQMYVENKLHFLRSKGWEVYIFYYMYAENVLLPGLEEYKDKYIPELKSSIKILPRHTIKKVVDKIQNIVSGDNSGERIIVESQLVDSALWGELIAERLHARHILNILEERIPAFNEKEHLFYEDKLIKRDILNATQGRIKSLFATRYKDGYLTYARDTYIPCANVVSDHADNNYQFEESDFTILSIGRLDKPYIMNMVEEIAEFARLNPSLAINFICIGGSYDGSKEGIIEKTTKGIDNIKLNLLGYIYPISRQLIQSANAAIACANSILVSANEGIPTIAIDIIDNMAIGIYGYTTMQKFKRKNEPQQKISDLLQQILDGKYPRDQYIENNEKGMEQIMEEELNYVLNNYHEGPYFNVRAICNPIKHVLHVVKYLFVNKFIGKN